MEDRARQGAGVVTFLRDLAHAAVALLVGGTVASLECLPGKNQMDMTQWKAPATMHVVWPGMGGRNQRIAHDGLTARGVMPASSKPE